MLRKIPVPVRIALAAAGFLVSLAIFVAAMAGHPLASNSGLQGGLIVGLIFLAATQYAAGGWRPMRSSKLFSVLGHVGTALVVISIAILSFPSQFSDGWQPIINRFYFPAFMSISYAMVLANLIPEYRDGASSEGEAQTGNRTQAPAALKPWQRQFLVPLLIGCATAGFCFSVLVQLLAFGGVVLGGNEIITLLTIGLPVPFVAMVIFMMSPSPDQTKGDWKIILSGCPRWLRALVRGLMIYTPVTAMLSWLMLGLAGAQRIPFDANWAGHAFVASAVMLFYAVAGAGLVTVYNKGPGLLSR